MKYIYALFLSLFIYGTTSAQRAPMAVYAEFGGPGLVSTNFDSRFTPSETGFGGRIGIGGAWIDRAGLYTIPLGVNYLLGKDGKNYFELGVGYTIGGIGAFDQGNSGFGFGNITIGYRLAPKDGGFLFKAQLTPIFGPGYFWPYYGGIAFGYKF